MGKVVKTVVGVVTTVVGVVTGNPALIIQGVSMTFSAVTEKKPKQAASQAAQQRLSKSLTPEVPRKIVLGKTAFPTDLRYWEVYGAKYTNYVEVMAAATHKVHSFGNLYIDEALVPFNGTAAGGKYAGALNRYTRNQGVSGQGIPLGSGTRWGTSAAMTGCAYWVLDWYWSQEKLPNGIPSRYTQEGEGSPVYDPRRDSTRGGSGSHRADDVDTWEYAPLDSNGEPIGRNNALQMLRILIGWRVTSPQTGQKVLVDGRGVNLDDINYPSFIEAANNCELERWYSDCVLSTGDSHSTNEGILEAAAGGKLADTGGRWSYRVATNDTANIAVNLTDDDFEGLQFEWKPRRPMSEQFNEVAGTYIDPVALYQARPFPLVYDQAYYDADGFKKRTTVSLSAVQDSAQAQKLMRIKLNAQRRQGVFRATFNWRPLLAENLNCVTLTFAPLGFTNKLFRIIEMGLTPNGVDLTLQEEDGAVYLGGTIAPYAPPSAGANYNSAMKIDVGQVLFTAWGVSGGNGSAQDAARLTWPLAPENVRNTEVRYRVNGTTPWTAYSGGLGRDQNVVIIAPLLPNTAYDFEVRHTSVDGVPGDWSPVGGTTNAVTRNAAGQIVYADGTPIDSLRPAEAGSNITENRVSAGFYGQGALATQSQVTWATQVTGVGRPEDYSTRSRVFRQSSPPTDPNTNDIWVVTDGVGNPLAVRAWNGSGWVTGADITGINTAAAITGQGPGATAPGSDVLNRFLFGPNDNRVFFSNFDRGTTGWIAAVPAPGGQTLATATHQGINYLDLSATFTAGDQTASVSQDQSPGYRIPVRAGERLSVQFGAEIQGPAAGANAYLWFRDAAGNAFANALVVTVPAGSTYNTQYSNFVDVPTGAVSAFFEVYLVSAAAGSCRFVLTRPMVTSANVGQLLHPPYSPGPASVPGSDPTGLNTAAAIFGQGWGATANQDQAGNDRVRVGYNMAVNSDFRRQLYAWGSTNGGPVNSGLNGDFGTPYFGRRNTFWARVNGTPPATYYDLGGTKMAWGDWGWGTLEDTKRYCMPVRPGDRVGFSVRHGAHRCTMQLYLLVFSRDGVLLEAPFAQGTFNNGGNPGAGDGYELSGIAALSHPDAAYAGLMFRILTDGVQSDPYLFVSEPLMAKLNVGQTVLPAYTSGPADPIGDQTATNVAGGIVGQGPLATANFPYYAGMSAAIAAGLGNGRQFFDTTNSNTLTTVVINTGGGGAAGYKSMDGQESGGTTYSVIAQTDVSNFTANSFVEADIYTVSNGYFQNQQDTYQGAMKLTAQLVSGGAEVTIFDEACYAQNSELQAPGLGFQASWSYPFGALGVNLSGAVRFRWYSRKDFGVAPGGTHRMNIKITPPA